MKKRSSRMLKHLPGQFLLAFLLLGLYAPPSKAQVTPVAVNMTVNPPYSNYLFDYYANGKNSLQVNLTFKDMHEASWNVFLRFNLESSLAGVANKPDFVPSEPIEVFPGQTVSVSGAELEEYFLPQNIYTKGISQAEFASNRKIPDGLYTFKVQAYDYNSQKAISNESRVLINIRRNKPPIITGPTEGSIVKVTEPQNFTFQWQLSSLPANELQNIEYTLRVYEISNDETLPEKALADNQVLEIFKEEGISNNSFNYHPGCPPLEAGKRYVATVQAQNLEGKDMFENNGTSKASWFFYGYPQNGKIILKSPANEDALAIFQRPSFQWSIPSKKLKEQPVRYQFRIVKIEKGQEAEEAIENNQVWYEYETKEYWLANDISHTVYKSIDRESDYAWKVMGLSGSQKVAESPVFTLYGPPLVDEILIGTHKLKVLKLDNKDMAALKGKGRLQMGSGDFIDVNFDSLEVKDMAGIFILQNGKIECPITKAPQILSPEYGKNGEAKFHFEAMRLTTEMLKVKGHITWDFPFAVNAPEKGVVRTTSNWVNFGNYKVNGGAALAKGNVFELLNPIGYVMALSEKSMVYVMNDVFRLEIDGTLTLPKKYKDGSEQQMVLPFEDAKDLFYIVNKKLNVENALHVVPKTGIYMRPRSMIIDLSDEKSPEKQAHDKEWVGVYIDNFELIHKKSVDERGQISYDGNYVHSFSLSNSNTSENYFTSAGWDLVADKKCEEKETGLFNTFPCDLNRIYIKKQNDAIAEAYLKGGFLIPIISETKKFAFTVPLLGDGFHDGALDQSLDGYQYTFNKDGGEQSVKVTINRAVFKAKERLDMNIDMFWPKMGAQFSRVGGFRIWGNGQVGFFKPNGLKSLTNQVSVKYNSYDINFDVVGAGASAGGYSLGISGDILLGEDVSGEEGAPKVNLYSTVANKYAPKETKQKIEYKNVHQEGTPASNKKERKTDESEIDQQIKRLNKELADIKEKENKLKAKAMQRRQEALATIDYESINGPMQPNQGTNYFKPNELDKRRGFHVSFNKDFSVENLLDLLELFVALSNSDKAEQFKKYKDRVLNFSREEQIATYNDLKKFNELKEKLIKKQIKKFTSKITDPIKKASAKLNAKINKPINSFVDSLSLGFHSVFSKLIEPVATKVIEITANEFVDVSPIVYRVKNRVITETTDNFRSSLRASIQDNILAGITDSLIIKGTNRIINKINQQAYQSVADILDGRMPKLEVEGLASDIFNGLIRELQPQNILSNFRNASQQFINDFNFSSVYDDMVNAVLTEVGNIKRTLGKTITTTANKQVQDFIDDQTDNLGGSLNVGVDVSLNFNDMGDNLKKGRIDKIIQFDAVHVKVKTKVVQLDGYVNYDRSNPTYGDVWMGNISVIITKPKKFAITAIYMNGKKDGLNYWFCQVEPPRTNKLGQLNARKYEIGGPISREAKELYRPKKLGAMEIVGAAGRVYSHMREEKGQRIVPDASNDYGAYLNLVIRDKKHKGERFFLNVYTEFIMNSEEDFKLTLGGEFTVNGKRNTFAKLDPLAEIWGSLEFTFNSAEDHFYGGGEVTLLKKNALCGEGNFYVDIKPGKWSLRIGSRDKKIIFVPGCIGWSATGWLALNQEKAVLGLGIMLSADFTFAMDKGRVSLAIRLFAGAAAGINAIVNYKPFGVDEAGLWLDLWAKITVAYKIDYFIGSKSGEVNLIDILVQGDLTMRFHPSPTTLYGRVKGKLTVCNVVSLSFHENVEMEM